jgi:hypothetical protein
MRGTVIAVLQCDGALVGKYANDIGTARGAYPDPPQQHRGQAGKPVIVLSEFPEPAVFSPCSFLRFL